MPTKEVKDEEVQLKWELFLGNGNRQCRASFTIILWLFVPAWVHFGVSVVRIHTCTWTGVVY